MFFNEKHIWITGTTGDYCCNRKVVVVVSVVFVVF